MVYGVRWRAKVLDDGSAGRRCVEGSPASRGRGKHNKRRKIKTMKSVLGELKAFLKLTIKSLSINIFIFDKLKPKLNGKGGRVVLRFCVTKFIPSFRERI